MASTIVVKLKGGLGNQMFQYAFGRSLSLKYGAALKLDKSLLTWSFWRKIFGTTPRKYELGEFNIRTQDETLGKDIVNLNGYWQNEKYFRDSRRAILKDFSLKKESAGFKKLTGLIARGNSVSIHFRRGDYAKNKTTRMYHGILGFGYYRKAISLTARKVKNPHFFVFSDDIDWVEKNFKINYPTIYVNKLYGLTNPEELILMSLCKHNIIANSSFSWWAAWLNKNPGKIVLAPKKWFRSIKTGPEIIPQGWIKVL